MWKSVTLIIFLCLTHGNSKLIPEMTCYRFDQQPPDLSSEAEKTWDPSTFLNMVEQFTSLEDIVLLKAGEKIAKDEDITSFEYFRLGIFRKSNFFYIVLVIFYLYWLFYGFLTFVRSQKEFDALILPFRGFYLKNLILLVYAVFIFLTIYNIYDTFGWIIHYSNVYHGRESKMNEFLKEYEEAINFTSLRFTCYMEQMPTEMDEIEAFHRRIRRYHLQNVPRVEYIINTISNTIGHIKQDCDVIASACGLGPEKLIIANWSVLSNLQNFTVKPSELSNWDRLSDIYENIKYGTLNTSRSDFDDLKQISRKRLMLVRNVYPKIERIFMIPHPLVIISIYGLLFIFVTFIVFVSVVSFFAMLRGRDYLQKNGIVGSLVGSFKKFNYIYLAVACFTLLWSWLIIIFSSASHSLYLNVLRDSKMEVLGKLNITDSKRTFHFNLRDFLNSSNDAVIEDLFSINPQTILKQNNDSWKNVQEWHSKITKQLEKNISLYAPIETFCVNIEQMFRENTGKWIDKRGLELGKITNLCKIAKENCMFCEFKNDLKDTVFAAKQIRELSLTVANRTGDDFEDFRYLHEKYRLQIWNDYVAPITFLENPSIIFPIILYVLGFMMMTSISMIETEDQDETNDDRYQYYQIHTADRGLYWFNL